MMKLIDCGEISIGGDTYLQTFHSFFQANDEIKKQQKKQYNYLRNLLEEYNRTESKKCKVAGKQSKRIDWIDDTMK